jgi:nucleotide-binding universal stress UspA family protein
MSTALPDWNTAVRPSPTLAATEPKSLVLPLDGSKQGRVAFPVAKKLAQIYGATLHVTYAGTGRFDLTNAAIQLGLTDEEAQAAIFQASTGSPVDDVIRLARELPDALLVMSTAIGAQKQVNRFGSFTELLFADKPPLSVVVNPEGDEQPWHLRRILLAHDGTPVSKPAVGPAAYLAQRAGAEVIALHVAARGETRPDARGSIAAPLYVDQPQHEWPGWAEEFMNRVVASGAVDSGVHFKLRVSGGQAGSELAHVARERKVDLVVMAWHGHWAEHDDCATRVVVRNAGCPVMLVYSARKT